jgi:hypothetical protein
VTFREGAVEDGIQSLDAKGLNMANAADFKDQTATLQAVESADALVFPEIGSAVVSGTAFKEFGIRALGDTPSEGQVETIEPE